MIKVISSWLKSLRHKTPKFKGVKVTLGDGREYVIPPLNLDQLDEHQADIDRLAEPELPVEEQRRIQAALVAASLSRNYPGITAEQVRALLDLRTIMPAVLAVMGVSGFEPGGAQPGE